MGNLVYRAIETTKEALRSKKTKEATVSKSFPALRLKK